MTATITEDVRVGREIQAVPVYLLGSELHSEWIDNPLNLRERGLFILKAKGLEEKVSPYYLVQGREDDSNIVCIGIYNEDGYYIQEYEWMSGLSIHNAYEFLLKE